MSAPSPGPSRSFQPSFSPRAESRSQAPVVRSGPPAVSAPSRSGSGPATPRPSAPSVSSAPSRGSVFERMEAGPHNRTAHHGRPTRSRPARRSIPLV
jgi:hypothetical protein